MKDLKFPYSKADINDSDIKAVVQVLKKEYIAQGKIVQRFEEKLKSEFDVSEAIVCNSGTAALHSVYRSLGLDKKMVL